MASIVEVYERCLPLKSSFQAELMNDPESPMEIWIVEGRHLGDIETLKEKLFSHYSDVTNTITRFQTVTKGLICVAALNNNSFARVRVDFVFGKEIDARNIDTGKMEVVSASNLFPIDPVFKSIPSYAHKCCLADIFYPEHSFSWSKRVINYLGMLIQNSQVVTVQVVGYCFDSHLIKMFTKTGLDISELLVNVGLARKIERNDLQLIYNPFIDLNKKTILSGSKISNMAIGSLDASILSQFSSSLEQVEEGIETWVVVEHAVNPNFFFICVLSQNWLQLETFEKNMTKYYVENRVNEILSSVTDDTLFAIENKNKNLYQRACILYNQGDPSNTATVIYVDHGYSEKKLITDIKKLDSQFFSFPYQCILCTLGLPIEDWNEQDSEYFTKLVKKRLFLAKIIKKHKNRLEIDLHLQMDNKSLNGYRDVSEANSIKEQVIDFVRSTRGADSLGMCVNKSLKLNIVEGGPNSAIISNGLDILNGIANINLSDEKSVSKEKQFKEKFLLYYVSIVLKPGDKVFINYATGPSDFYVISLDKETKKQFKLMMKELRKFCTGKKTTATSNTLQKSIINIDNLIENQILAVLHEDNWNRAIVLNIAKEIGRITIQLIDFGTVETVDFSVIKLIPEFLSTNLPPFAIKCSLDLRNFSHMEDILPKNATKNSLDVDWSMDIKSWFVDTYVGGDENFIVGENVIYKDERNWLNLILDRVDLPSKSISDELLELFAPQEENYQEICEKSKKLKTFDKTYISPIKSNQSLVIKNCDSLYVTYVKDPNEFYVQIKPDIVISIDSFLNNKSSNISLKRCKKLSVGDLIRANFDYLWSRARVIGLDPVNSNETDYKNVNVFLIDYGNTLNVTDLSLLAELPNDDFLHSTPNQAQKCSLINANALLGCIEIADKFKTLCEDKTFLADNVSFDHNGMYCIDLKHQDSSDIYLISNILQEIFDNGKMKTKLSEKLVISPNKLEIINDNNPLIDCNSTIHSNNENQIKSINGISLSPLNILTPSSNSKASIIDDYELKSESDSFKSSTQFLPSSPQPELSFTSSNDIIQNVINSSPDMHLNTTHSVESLIGKIVQITYSNNPGDFYILVQSDTFLQLLDDLRKHCENNAKAYRPNVKGELVAALFDGLWFRAKVLELLPHYQYRIQFTDYGNIEIVPDCDIRPLLPEISSLFPKPAIKCTIDSLYGTESDGTWTENSIEYFKENFDNRFYKVSSIKEMGLNDAGYNEKLFDVDLILVDDNTNLREALVASNIARNKFKRAEGFDLQLSKQIKDEKKYCNNKNSSSICSNNGRLSQNSSHSSQNSRRFYLEDLPKLNLSPEFQAVVTIVSTPSFFWCQELQQTLDMTILIGNMDLDTEMKNHYRAAPNEICLGFHAEYNEWYRAHVISIDESKNYTVRLLDYGDLVDLTLLISLPNDLRTFAPSAHKCKLRGIKPISEKWSDEANQYFESLTKDQIVNVSILQACDNSTEVNTVSLRTNDQREVKEIMISQNLALED